MQPPTQDPSSVENDDIGVVGDLVLALNEMDRRSGCAACHDNFPTTASIAAAQSGRP